MVVHNQAQWALCICSAVTLPCTLPRQPLALTLQAWRPRHCLTLTPKQTNPLPQP